MLNLLMDYNSTNNRIFQLKENFFANEFDPGKKHVFILGASSVAHLNSSYINQFIQDPEILVYNLAVPADRPAERLQTIDKLASAFGRQPAGHAGGPDREQPTEPRRDRPAGNPGQQRYHGRWHDERHRDLTGPGRRYRSGRRARV